MSIEAINGDKPTNGVTYGAYLAMTYGPEGNFPQKKFEPSIFSSPSTSTQVQNNPSVFLIKETC